MGVISKVISDNLFMIEALTEAAISELKIFDSYAPAAFQVIDAYVISELTGSGDTVKITDGTNDIVAAMATATIDLLVRAVDIDLTFAKIAAGGSLSTVTASGAAGRVFILCQRTN